MKQGQIYFNKDANRTVRVIDFIGNNRLAVIAMEANADSAVILPIASLRKASEQEVKDHVLLRSIRNQLNEKS